MTIAGFLRELRSAVDMGLSFCERVYPDGGAFRSNTIPGHSHCACPISALASFKTGEHFSTFRWRDAAKSLGLDEKKARLIVNAADARQPMDDDINPNTHRRLRHELREACNVAYVRTARA